ncbi:cation:proton antiporter [Agromyces atrinae]|uniref:CPA2 family monovalent cation:H+ antiporter-2 n=1 Tax=Agromyces atrinae TaxID=592376 RepID=A0A4Q2M5P9_9MICO|nr:cation:proton antiporter [Agromyces atrinae]NYD66821.1 CPA2 family monovalent cation:H+ antiporter-2 [Agromyces atrinae]RXZ87474.1 cation:proton antiporter [Agromyces atrinae]
MHLGEDLITLGLLFVVAYGLGRLAKLIGLPSIPVYMIVGLLASPNTTWIPINFESHYLELIAVFGLILLLFNLGLEFDQDEFFANAGKLLVSGGSYVVINMGVGLIFGFMVGWGTREALIIAGMTATSSSAIVTKLLIELGRLPNRETPMILGVTVIEDMFIAIYLAIVSVVLSGETELWPMIGKLAIAFTFLVVMFTVARWGGRWVSTLFKTKDDELFTILFFGLAMMFGGLGEVLGVTDAIGAFLIGLVLGATRYHAKIEQIAVPLRDVFAAFFFVNFGLSMDIGAFPDVVLPVAIAVVMTVVLNILAGQFVAWLNGMGPQQGINTTVILQNRGEFALILATLSLSAGLDPRIQPFAGLYVLVMSIMGPILAANSEKIGAVILRSSRRRPPPRPRERSSEAIALVEAATRGDAAPQDGPSVMDSAPARDNRESAAANGVVDPRSEEPSVEVVRTAPVDVIDDFDAGDGTVVGGRASELERLARQAMAQSDHEPTTDRETDS